jgi:hypothetical protein
MVYTFWGEHAMQQNHQHDGTFAEKLFQTEPLKHNKSLILFGKLLKACVVPTCTLMRARSGLDST